jgi:phosphatidylglycerophosphate synthase
LTVVEYRHIDKAIGAKKSDYWWTVLAVDPVALPIVRLLFRRRWLSPDQVTWLVLATGIPVGLLFATGERAGLIAGAVLFYVSFVLDCVDGKLARALEVTSPRGKALDEMADATRRASASIGLAAYLWRAEDAHRLDIWWALVYGVLAFYFMEISGAQRADPSSAIGGRWTAALARRRLLPTPGMPDASAVVFVIGPLTGFVVPALGVGIVLMVAAIAITFARRMRVS